MVSSSEKYLIRIRGHHIPQGPQNYALVVTGGNFTQLDQELCASAFSLCPNNCRNNGQCVAGMCECYPFFFGTDCAQEAIPLSVDTQVYMHHERQEDSWLPR